MSKKDGRATLINATNKRDVFILKINEAAVDKSKIIAAACPVRIIKVQ